MCLPLPAGLWASLPNVAQEINPVTAPGVQVSGTGSEKGKVTSKEEGTLFSQLTHVLTAYDYLYCHEKAEEFSPVQNHPYNPERELGKIDLTNLPEKEFKIKVITMLMDLHRNMQELKDQVGR